MKGIIITIDGPAGSGKTTIARAVSEHTRIPYLNTGALYRAVASAWHARGTQTSPQSLLDTCEVAARYDRETQRFEILLDGEPVPETQLQTETVGELASRLAAEPAVRKALLGVQRRAVGRAGCVVEGRDMGTVVFPDAPWKFFLSADVGTRAARRAQQLGLDPGDPDVLADIARRDQRDKARAVAPLRIPPGAIVLDTTHETVDEIVKTLIRYVDLGT